MGWISVQFDVDLCENLLRKLKFGLQLDKNIGHLTWRPKCMLLLLAVQSHHKIAVLEGKVSAC